MQLPGGDEGSLALCSTTPLWRQLTYPFLYELGPLPPGLGSGAGCWGAPGNLTALALFKIDYGPHPKSFLLGIPPKCL